MNIDRVPSTSASGRLYPCNLAWCVLIVAAAKLRVIKATRNVRKYGRMGQISQSITLSFVLCHVVIRFRENNLPTLLNLAINFLPTPTFRRVVSEAKEIRFVEVRTYNERI
ncbi:uncharacterized protein RAG0_05689 [Rhynchosporium agropyri]|uniref:Uncharacterized protein n=1 Tax=Rhynchosporium agropyri TaxID=914238 RepID=A0A1E1KE75_9HELO|nr:uncharacterized protein RAG0_05689 [Rhynchosporium agropyri]